MCKEVASSKKMNSRLKCKNRYPICYQNGGKMATIDTLFMTKRGRKPYPLGPHRGRTYLYSPYKGVTPPPGSFGIVTPGSWVFGPGGLPYERGGVLVVSLKGVNFGFLSQSVCSEQNATTINLTPLICCLTKFWIDTHL